MLPAIYRAAAAFLLKARSRSVPTQSTSGGLAVIIPSCSAGGGTASVHCSFHSIGSFGSPVSELQPIWKQYDGLKNK